MPVSACNLKKNIFRFAISSKHSNILVVVLEKSIRIYESYSFSPKLCAIVDLPTRLAPSNKTAYLSEYFSFHSNNLLYTFLLKFITFPFQN